jgi:hypothetical protein
MERKKGIINALWKIKCDVANMKYKNDGRYNKNKSNVIFEA